MPVLLGLTLFAFGAALGSLDVAMNIHGVEVERAALRPLMSGFHALFSVGGFAGATVITFLLSLKIAPLAGGFLLIGLGASNIVPVLFRGAGAQRAMPAGLAVAAITTAGYAGVLVGPAAIGLVAKSVGLPVAFWLLAALVSAVVLSARTVTAPRT